MARHESEARESEAKSSKPGQKATHPSKWWQWMLLYPGLLVSVLGAVPTYIEAARSMSLGVPFGQSGDARLQNRLWQDNFECSKNIPLTTVRTKQAVEIASIVCESGDILLSGKRPEWSRPQYRWVAWSDVASNAAAVGADTIGRLSPIASAHAQEVPQSTGRAIFQRAQLAGSQLLCQRWVGQGLLLQRYGTPQGCFDQIVNTYNGVVVNRYPAACSNQC